jgi:hypothetical protein
MIPLSLNAFLKRAELVGAVVSLPRTDIEALASCAVVAAAIFASRAVAATPPPRIFFTDLASGPNSGGENNNGTIVTIYGKWFGAAQGTSTVTVGGGAVASYLQWGAAAPGPMGIEKIAVAIGSAAQTGPVVVHTANGDSNNDVTFTVRAGTIHCVSTTGSNTDTGDFPNHCWATIPYAKDTIAAGDIAYIEDGVTQTAVDNYSAALSLDNNGATNTGTAGMPKALVAYPGATVTVGTPTSTLGIRTPNICATFQYWVLAGFVIRGETGLSLGQDYFTVVGNDLSCTGASGYACIEPYGNYQNYWGNYIHDTGQACGCNPNTCKLYHAVYFGVSNHDEFAWNVVDPDPNHTGVAGCRAIQFHTTDCSGLDDYDIHVHDNIIRDAICDGINLVTVDPDLGPVEVYNNVIYHVGTGPAPAGVESDYACVYTSANANPSPTANVEIYNNTVYDCGSRGNGSSGGFTVTINTRLRNNIVLAVDGAEPYLTGASSGCVTGSNNIFFGAGAPPTCANLGGSINSDPELMSVMTGDFHLMMGSPARNAGVTISTLLTDLDGVLRPQGTAYAIGAYEYDVGFTPPPQPDAGLDAGMDAGAGQDAGQVSAPDGGRGGDGGPGSVGGGCNCANGGMAVQALLFATLLPGLRRRRRTRGLTR